MKEINEKYVYKRSHPFPQEDMDIGTTDNRKARS